MKNTQKNAEKKNLANRQLLLDIAGYDIIKFIIE